MARAMGGGFDDLRVVARVARATDEAQSGVMLARVRPGGVFELLTSVAWARALGCVPEQLNGKSLRELMQLELPTGKDIVAALFDERIAQPLEVMLRCTDERRKPCRLHRRHDAYEGEVFVVAEEVDERVRRDAS